LKRLKVEQFGDNAQGVNLYGDPKRQLEPEMFMVRFPGGEVEISRCSDGSHWIHVGTRTARNSERGVLNVGRFIDSRVDCDDKHASETIGGDFVRPETYHVAVRVAARGEVK
jgi:hypothetical protein